jgi:heme-degrading monooxygenase HmoA
MIAVIFEVLPRPDRKDDYFRIAADLRSELEKIDGFISVERFESLARPGKFLSLSLWKDERAVTKWRSFSKHRHAQSLGRTQIFEEYRLLVAEVVRDYGLRDRDQAPSDSYELH